MTQFSPHTATVNVVSFDPVSPARVYSTSYDGTVRCLDLNHQTFDLVHARSSSYDSWLQHSCLTPDGRGLVVGDSDGMASFLDLRTKKVKEEVEERQRCGVATDH